MINALHKACFDKHTSNARVPIENANLIVIFIGWEPPWRKATTNVQYETITPLHIKMGVNLLTIPSAQVELQTPLNFCGKLFYIMCSKLNMTIQVTFVIMRLHLHCNCMTSVSPCHLFISDG